ncbi:MAG: O-antigen ligase family protein [Gemmatimonadaceae bacterium]|nr:O-antigen ligase family protein [Gemmatimonadaceae bacterium]
MATRAIDSHALEAGSAGPRAVVFVALMVLVSVATFLATGSGAVAALPVLAVAAGYAIWSLPLRHSLYPFLFVSLVVFEPPHGKTNEDLATSAVYQGIIKPAYDLVYENLNKVTGIGALRVSGGELVYLLLLALMLVRFLRGERIDRRHALPGSNVLYALCAIAFATMIGLEVWGALRGGDVRGSFFQIRPLVWVPFLVAIFSYALRDERDFLVVAVIATVAACVKIALGAYVLLGDIRPKGVNPEYMTGHHDSVLFIGVLFMWWAAWLHRPTVKRLVFTAPLSLWLIFGLVLNNRRIAWVGLLFSLLVLYFLLEGRVKRWATRLVFAALPLLAVYLLVSRHVSSGIFKPGAQIMSVAQQKDASSIWRDVENFNLLATLREHPIVGSGWGHEYVEVIKADDISRFMPQYRLVPHNDILWLLGVAGVVGFALLWMPMVAGVFLAARSYRFSASARQRTAAATAIALVVLYANQCWGDMGMIGPVPTLLLACALALAGKLARATGAWPARAAVFARHPEARG